MAARDFEASGDRDDESSEEISSRNDFENPTLYDPYTRILREYGSSQTELEGMCLKNTRNSSTYEILKVIKRLKRLEK